MAEQLIALKQVPGWLARHGVVSPSGRPLSLRTIYDWRHDGRLRVTDGLPRLHVRVSDLEALVRLLDEEPVISSSSGRRMRRDAEWQRRQEEADARLRNLGVV